MTKSKISIYVLSLCLIACGTNKKDQTEGNDSLRSAQKEENRITEVKVTELQYENFVYELISNGTVEVRQKAELKFQSSEIITKIYVSNGDRVSRGQKIAELAQFKLRHEMEQADIALQRAKLELQDVLIGQGYALGDSAKIPSDIMQIARIRSNYDQSVNSYRLAKYNLEMSVLTAPFDGVIANLSAKPFNYPSSDPLCTIIDTKNPEVVFNVLETELPKLHVGDRTLVSTFSSNSDIVEGRIREINPMVDKNGMVKIKAQISNNGMFFEGMKVKVRVQRDPERQLVIPKSALVLRTNKKVVFTVKNGRAQWHYVDTSHENSESYVVTSGLAAGDSIIYEGNINLADQSPVTVISEQ